MSMQSDTTEPVSPPSVILVTGGTGLVGAYVIRDLVSKGFTVKAIKRNNTIPSFIDASTYNKVKWISGDILDPASLEDAMENTDAVIHSAAVVSFHSNHRQQLFNTNIEGTANVVNTAIDKKIRKLIYVSSVAAIGKSNNGALVNESSKWQDSKLNSNYAISKHLAEMEVWRGIAEGLQAVIVNPSTILGFGNWNNSSSAIFRNVYNEFPWYTNGVTGFVDVEDVSLAIVQLLATNIHSERFILNGDNWTYRKLLDTIADGFGRKKPHREATPFLAGIAWRLEKLRSMLNGNNALLTRESARAAQSNTRFDNSKILQALPGFQFTDLEQTIRKACERYKQIQ